MIRAEALGLVAAGLGLRAVLVPPVVLRSAKYSGAAWRPSEDASPPAVLSHVI